MNIVYFSPITWRDLKQRPQHIAEELSLHHTITFVEPSISFISSLIRRNNDYRRSKVFINAQMNVTRPSGAFRLPKSAELVDYFRINSLYERSQLRTCIDQSDLIWLGSPIFYPLISDVRNKVIVFDKMDDYVQLSDSYILKKVLQRYENKLIKKADIIFLSSQSFYDATVIHNDNVFVVNNAFDSNIGRNPVKNNMINELENLIAEGKRIFGYVGTIDTWFDFDVIERIISSDENNHVVIIGRNNLKRVPHSKQLHYYNPIPKEEINDAIHTFHFCLYPFIINDFINTINPVKIYEYLSCNKKTIAARSVETERFEPHIKLYSSIEELTEILTELDSIEAPFDPDGHEDFIREHSWSNRVAYLRGIIDKVVTL